MGVLKIDFDCLGDFEHCVGLVVNSLDDLIEGYAGIDSGVGVLSTSRANLDSCNYYLKKKVQMLQEKERKLEDFRREMVAFVRDAEETDRRVADYIQEHTDLFEEVTGIQVATGGVLAFLSEKIDDLWESFVEPLVTYVGQGIKALGGEILKFYEEHKYIIDFAVDLVLLAAAVVGVLSTGGILGGVVAIFLTFEAASSFYGSTGALICAASGNMEEAERWSEVNGRQLIQDAGQGLDTLIGCKFFEHALVTLHTGLTIVAAVYSVGKTVTGVSDLIKTGSKNTGVITSEKSWGGIVKEFFGFKEKVSAESASDFIKITRVSTRLHISPKTAENLINWSTNIKNITHAGDIVATVIKNAYKTGNDQVVAGLEATGMGGLAKLDQAIRASGLLPFYEEE